MNKMIFIIALLITFNVHAIDFEKREKYFRSVSTCFKGVYVQGDLMAVGTSYQDILLINYQTGKEKIVSIDMSINDFVLFGGKLYILTDKNIRIYSIENSIFES